MFASDHHHPPCAEDVDLRTEAGLFLWRGAGIVLLGHFDGERWIVARGWLHSDSLGHIRRWSFPSASACCGQIRRLIQEATGNDREAATAGSSARTWAAFAPHHG
jgi:hypothetical protein